jgi:hypothetical protein
VDADAGTRRGGRGSAGWTDAPLECGLHVRREVIRDVQVRSRLSHAIESGWRVVAFWSDVGTVVSGIWIKD